MMLENSNIIIGLICAIFGAGFSAGLMLSKFMSKDKCEHLRTQCEQKRCDELKGLTEAIKELEKKFNDSLVRVHTRLDQILDKKPTTP